MPIQVLHFDVFTTEPGKGNPAGIVLSADGLENSAMQSLANETGCNDTAFLLQSQVADYRIRYFSPRKEVELCGHATIAAAMALHTHGLLLKKTLPCDLLLETMAGVLPITIDTSASGELLVFMTQAPAQFKPFVGDRSVLMESLGVTAAELHPSLPIVYGSTGRWTLVVPVRDLDAMRRMQPNPSMFAGALVEIPGASIHPFCLETIDRDADMHARHFSSPTSGTIEDPVTGTASGVLGAYYRQFVNKSRDVSQPLIVEQGYEVQREGRVLAWAVESSGGYAVRIAGTACFVGEQSYS